MRAGAGSSHIDIGLGSSPKSLWLSFLLNRCGSRTSLLWLTAFRRYLCWLTRLFFWFRLSVFRLCWEALKTNRRTNARCLCMFWCWRPKWWRLAFWLTVLSKVMMNSGLWVFGAFLILWWYALWSRSWIASMMITCLSKQSYRAGGAKKALESWSMLAETWNILLVINHKTL